MMKCKLCPLRFGEFNYLQRKDCLDVMGGDPEALHKALEMAKETGRELLDWMRMETMEDVVPAIRFMNQK